MPRSGVVDEIACHRGLASLPEAWVELAHGRISADDAVERVRSEEPEALAQRTARMLTPPSAARSRALLRELLDERFTAPPPSAPRSIRGIVGMLALVAAAVVLLVMPRQQPAPSPFDAGYELELSPGLAFERDVPATDEVPRYRPDRTVTLTLRPAHRVADAVEARAFATHDDGRTVSIAIESRSSPLGVVEIVGRPRAWGLEPGRWQLTTVVGPVARLPDAWSDVRMDPDAPYDVQQAWIEILEDAPAEH